MTNAYYKGYWMVTNRCNLHCSYCVLENAPHQLRTELNLHGKKELVSHLYHNLGFRRLTLSGGEVTIFGKQPPNEFIKLLRHIRSFRSSDPLKNLEIELYTNGTRLDERVASEMQGSVDTVAVTIDGIKDSFLSEIGRNYRSHTRYFDHIVTVCGLLSARGIEIKLHSVIGKKNNQLLAKELPIIFDAVESVGAHISCWKFFQYMSYDAPERDQIHAISADAYNLFKQQAEQALKGRHLRLHFKDNNEMNASLFNILSYGNAQYMREGDSWSSSQRTEDLRSYSSMLELFAKHDIDEDRFRRFHEIIR